MKKLIFHNHNFHNFFAIFSTSNKEGPYHCKLCADSFFSESDLNNHEKTKHVKIQTYQCKICNYCSLEKSLMIRHMRTHSGRFYFRWLEYSVIEIGKAA